MTDSQPNMNSSEVETNLLPKTQSMKTLVGEMVKAAGTPIHAPGNAPSTTPTPPAPWISRIRTSTTRDAVRARGSRTRPWKCRHAHSRTRYKTSAFTNPESFLAHIRNCCPIRNPELARIDLVGNTCPIGTCTYAHMDLSARLKHLIYNHSWLCAGLSFNNIIN